MKNGNPALSGDWTFSLCLPTELSSFESDLEQYPQSCSWTLNEPYIDRIYKMSSWQFSMGFILFYVNLSICEMNK